MAYSRSPDEDIIAEAVRSGCTLPIVRIPLYRFRLTDPDVADVDFRTEPPTVTRRLMPRPGENPS